MGFPVTKSAQQIWNSYLNLRPLMGQKNSIGLVIIKHCSLEVFSCQVPSRLLSSYEAHKDKLHHNLKKKKKKICLQEFKWQDKLHHYFNHLTKEKKKLL